MDEKYVTIATFATTGEANFFKDQLMSKGIQAFVSEGQPLLEPVEQNNNENARLNVKKEDFQEAAQIVKSK